MNKTAYLNCDSPETQFDAWLETCAPRGLLRPDEARLGSDALLVVDVQEAFFNPASHAWIPSSAALERPVLDAVSVFLERKRPVLFCRHAETDNSAHAAFSRFWKNRIQEGSPLSEFCPWLPLRDGAGVFRKSAYSAFHLTDFATRLATLGAQRLFLAGVATHLCLESTARAAFDHGYLPVLLADACAAWNATQHVRALADLSEGVALIGSVKALREANP